MRVMTTATVGALALRPTGNQQGNCNLFSLRTGRLLNRTLATRLPMPVDVMDRVHKLARRQKINPGLVFLDHNRIEVDNDDDTASGIDNSSYHPDSDDDDV